MRNDHHPRAPRRTRPKRPNGARALLRSRWVQGTLAAATAVQVGIASARHHLPSTPIPGASAGVASRQASTKGRPMDAASSAPGRGLEATAVRLADEYRGKGFRLTDELARAIVAAADSNGIAPRLAFGLIATESEFKRTAKSPVGAIGLAQLMPATAALFRPGITRSDLTEPETNLGIGFRFLGELVDRYGGDTALALTAYNRGTGTVDRILARGGDPDNGYAGKVHDPHPSD
ncbi:MAG: hypothetical protein JWM27_215 [Gemmatimonadetes bacterium]|nr:hypothetical protein [Gemmatimonadota bacterium]